MMNQWCLILTAFWIIAGCFPVHSTKPDDIEQIYRQSWVVELLNHPLRVSFFHPNDNDSVHDDNIKFSGRPHSLRDRQAKLAAKHLSSRNSYEKGTSSSALEFRLKPIVMLRFENEQQTIDFIIDQSWRSYSCYLNGEFQLESSSPAFLFQSTTAKLIRQLYEDVLAEE